MIVMTQLHLYLEWKKKKNPNKRKLEAQDLEKSAYIFYDFFGASDAIVDHIWSKPGVFKTNRRKGGVPSSVGINS